MVLFRTFIIAVLSCLCLPAFAAGSEIVKTVQVSSRIIAEHDAVMPGQTIWLGLEQRIAKGWHVYWQNPGDSGLPLSVSLTSPSDHGLVLGSPLYPAPQRFDFEGFVNFGHKDEPVFLLPLTVPSDVRIGTSLLVTMDVQWLVCAEVCIPESASFTVPLSVADEPVINDGARATFEKARALLPQPFPGQARYRVQEGHVWISMTPSAVLKNPDAELFFFPALEGAILPSGPQQVFKTETTGEVYVKALVGHLDNLEAHGPMAGVISHRDGHWWVEAVADDTLTLPANGKVISPVNVSARATPSLGSLSALFFLAILGGLLANLMPCVFPILFIKAVTLADSSTKHFTARRRDGIAYSAGVLTCFALLGGALIIFRAFGSQLGWGFHLQSPGTIATSAMILMLVGLNFCGTLTFGQSLQSFGGQLLTRFESLGAFGTGLLAVFIAAPCIGPFLGAPLGAALVLSPMAGFGIFLAIGLGFAAPFAALAFIPALARIMPKPGPWMQTLRRILSIPVFLSALYFLWVLSRQIGALPAMVFGGGVAAAFVLAASLLQHGAGKPHGTSWQMAAVFLFGLAFLPVFFLGRLPSPAPTPAYGSLEAVPFEPERLQALRKEGKAVFVDFTAAWCVPCQVNKKHILSTKKFIGAARENDVTIMTADWTRRNETITKALAEHGASGVPLYVLYDGMASPTIFPLPLRQAALVSAFNGLDDQQNISAAP